MYVQQQRGSVSSVQATPSGMCRWRCRCSAIKCATSCVCEQLQGTCRGCAARGLVRAVLSPWCLKLSRGILACNMLPTRPARDM
jgi:hypothetical protein